MRIKTEFVFQPVIITLESAEEVAALALAAAVAMPQLDGNQSAAIGICNELIVSLAASPST